MKKDIVIVALIVAVVILAIGYYRASHRESEMSIPSVPERSGEVKTKTPYEKLKALREGQQKRSRDPSRQIVRPMKGYMEPVGEPKQGDADIVKPQRRTPRARERAGGAEPLRVAPGMLVDAIQERTNSVSSRQSEIEPPEEPFEEPSDDFFEEPGEEQGPETDDLGDWDEPAPEDYPEETEEPGEYLEPGE